jgi:regulator of protease activity HflC (stomatin/prohibitin superfamily)
VDPTESVCTTTSTASLPAPVAEDYPAPTMARPGAPSIEFSPSTRSFARSALFTIMALVVACVVGSASCTRVDPGHVGVRVKLAGSSRGVQNAPIVTGWVVYNPLTELVVEFPTSVQNVVWTKDLHEGSPVDESISFASSEGVTVNADVGLAFHIEPEKAPQLYGRFRQRDLMVLAHGYVRNEVREAINDAAARRPVQEIYGAGKTALINEALRSVVSRLSQYGFVIDQLTFNSALRLPDNVMGAINRAMEATQNAIQAENRVRQIRAEADQAIARAHGEAEAARQRAQGEADALLIRARAEAQANEIIRLSVTREVTSYRALERWDGHLPVVSGSSNPMPMLTLDAAQVTQLPEAERRARLRELLGAAPVPAAQAPTSPTPTAETPAPPTAPTAPARP